MGHSCEQPAQHEVRCRLVYILCDGRSKGGLQLAVDHQSGHLEYADALEFMLMVSENNNQIKETLGLTTMALPESNV